MVALAEEGDVLARALLVIAKAHRDAATGDLASALENAQHALRILEKGGIEGWTRTALGQHVEQFKEYVREGKPLPDLPSGL